MSDKKEMQHAHDAGRRSLDHYQRRLPAWRKAIRDFLIPIVRYETPRLAWLQKTFRSPALDAYFALTANFGTHTFYMIFLQFLFWHGYNQVFRAMINLLAVGVCITGVLKDLLCLPRPLSPPLQRISQSPSAPLEYGFPSTHCTNAVSVAVYGIYYLRQSTSPDATNLAAQCALYFFTTTIVIGRLYCGMHGFFDCIVGSLIGALLAVVQIMYGDAYDTWIWDGPFRNVLIVLLVVLTFVRVHPEPADDCPCFDDSVAFSGVIIGIQLGAWHFARTGFAIAEPVPSTAPYSLEKLGWIVSAARLLLGLATMLLWRAFMKSTLLKILPPLFRVFENFGVSLPRTYFLKASEYESVPTLRKDDSVIPPASDMLDAIRHPRRRTISIGPQSEADAYEMMAVRERRRRESRSSEDMSTEKRMSPTRPTDLRINEKVVQGHLFATDNMTPTIADDGKTYPFPVLEIEESLPGTHIDDQDDQALFAQLQPPRVRYDVEVVTKLVVYAGIGVIADDIAPILFELCGLSMGVRPW